MKVSNILVVCVGNICRSPLGASMLAAHLNNVEVGSAGIAAVDGATADPNVQSIAAEQGLDLCGHRSQSVTDFMVDSADLILAMDHIVRDEMRRRWPHASGKIFIYDHWTDRRGIEDPFRCSFEQHKATAQAIASATAEWLKRIQPTSYS